MWIFRWYVFYPLMALISGAVILASLGPALLPDPGPTPTAGAQDRGALVFAGEALAHPQVAANTVYFVPRGDRSWRPTGLRVAIRPNAGLVGERERGAEILLSPAATDWIGMGPLRIEVAIAPLPLSSANQLALGLQRGAGAQWSAKNVSAVSDTIIYEFAAAAAPVRGLSLRPISQDNSGNRGVEVRSIRVLHAAPPAPAPEAAIPETPTGAPEAPPPS
ncbi:MAG: hypothetical protein JNJ73_10170 [Hyphomonadaceae bacterium]|nr:hypothetical protein [Hyphomonadaceae bacterium]